MNRKVAVSAPPEPLWAEDEEFEIKGITGLTQEDGQLRLWMHTPGWGQDSDWWTLATPLLFSSNRRIAEATSKMARKPRLHLTCPLSRDTSDLQKVLHGQTQRGVEARQHALRAITHTRLYVREATC